VELWWQSTLLGNMPAMSTEGQDPTMNLDWIAGFFDGEGSVSAILDQDKKCFYGYKIIPHIQIAQKTKDILIEIEKFLNMGYVRVHYSKSTCAIKEETASSAPRDNHSYYKEEPTCHYSKATNVSNCGCDR
jgi:intein-encoded DNA endonuclease-like protein